LTKFKFH